MLVGLLGILKTGGAYLPLDTTSPPARLKSQLQESLVALLLTQEEQRAFLPIWEGTTLCLEEVVAELTQASGDNLPTSSGGEHLAYVISTSGSTGVPKGVMVRQSSVVNYTQALCEQLGVKPGWQYATVSTLAADLGNTAIFCALTSGGCVQVLGYETVTSGEAMANWTQQHPIDVLKIVPSHLSALLESERAGEWLPRRALVLGGEALSEPLVERVRRVGGSCEIYNHYGPTETTIGVLVNALGKQERVDERESAMVALGCPIANTQVYVLDVHLQPVPVGVSGELYVGGVGMARGYLHRPELTAERFIPHPWSQEAGARLYRTGDLARYQSNGNLEYLGRVDEQVKIWGYRIEPGEIEVVLGKHPQVRECVVAAREDLPGYQALVGYVVLQPEQAPSSYDLCSFLKERLPSYMVPSALVFLEKLPLTSNGKVDRRALPAPQNVQPVLAERFASPENALESTLVSLWSQLLRLPRVGIHDNFFALGGDSILSIQLVARARLRGLHFTPKQLFQHQTIAQLARVVSASPNVLPLPTLSGGPLPLTPIQRWFFARHLPDPHHYNQSLLLQAQQPLHEGRLCQALEYLVRYHDALRLRFVPSPEGDGWHQELTDFTTLTNQPFFLSLDLSLLPAGQQATTLAHVLAQAQASLDLKAGRLLRALWLIRGQDHPPLLLLLIHHLVVDSVSWRILLADLHIVYDQLLRQVPLQLPAQTTTWPQWVQRIALPAHVDVRRAELAYWLAPARQQVPALPIDLTEGETTVASQATVSCALSVEQTRALLQEVPSVYHTQIQEVLLTALALTLIRWSGHAQLLLNLEAHGREELEHDIDLSRTVGWFTALFPVLLDLTQATNLAEALISVKEQLRQVPGKGLGYGVLRYLSNDPQLEASFAQQAQAQVIFNYLGQLDATFDEDALFSPATISNGPAQSLRHPRGHLLEINGSVLAGQLHFNWRYSPGRHRPETIQHLAQDLLDTLGSLITHCQSPNAGGWTPADFPLARLERAQLTALLQHLPVEQAGQAGQQIEALYPLSPMQAGLLFQSLYAPEEGIYCTQLGWSITGKFEVDIWRQVWQQMIQRHAILRTGFVWEGLPQPLQVVYTQCELPYEELDWRGLSEQQQQDALKQVQQESLLTCEALAHAPLLRLVLVRMQEQHWSLHVSIHHLITDGWSQAQLLAEVQANYQALSEGRELHLKPVRPYQDYIAWLQEQDHTQAEQFWRTTLHGFTTPTRLPGASATGRNEHWHTAIQHYSCTQAFTRDVQARAQKLQVTLNTLLQGAWALLLRQYSAQENVLFGITTTGRPPELSGVETMLGVFINTLPVRVRIDPRMSLADWLRQLQREQVEARQYEYTPLVQIQRWSEVPSGQALFESLLVFQNYPVAASVLEQSDAIMIQRVATIEQTHYPLLLKVVPTHTDLQLLLQYDEARFDEALIRHMLQQLLDVLQVMVEQPELRLGELSLLSAQEQQQLAWSATPASFPEQTSIKQCFEQQVQQSPDATALIFEQETLSYAQLNQRANQLAHYLRARGVGPEVLVGVYIERSLEMVLGLLAVLKAGGTYVPFDPSYPTERLAFVLSDTRAPMLLTQQSLLEKVPAQGIQVLCLDTDWSVIAYEPRQDLAGTANAENLAYVIYTSGSTGIPKGVMVTHGNVLRLLAATQDHFHFQSQDVWTLFHSFAFDFSVWELWGALLYGARLVIVPYTVSRSPDLFSALLTTHSVTVLNQTPSAFRQLMQIELTSEQKRQRALRWIIFGGEALDMQSLRPWFERYGADEPQLVNMYGITETTVHVTLRPLSLQDVEQGTGSIIGKPLADLQVYVLDQYCQPVPIGVPGEIYVGGAGLARGYLNRPDLTSERFIAHPFNRYTGARLYKTGDQACFLPDGNLQYLGRVDQQVKIRGFRIEPGEIETLLGQHSATQSCVVIVREDTAGDKRLVAYIAPRPGVTPTSSELRRYLLEKLPEYMVPAIFVLLDALPLTANGKVDRRALPIPEPLRPDLAEALVLPRTPTEEIVAGIWSSVLGIEQVGIHDNFFALGGDSIRSIQVLSQARERGIYFSLRQLFQNQTIHELVQVIGAEAYRAHMTENVQAFSLISPQDRRTLPVAVEDAYPLTRLQSGMIFHSQYNPDSAVYHDIFSYQLQVDLNVQLFQVAMQHLVACHPILRTAFALGTLSEPLQLVYPTVDIPVQIEDLSHYTSTEQDALIAAWFEAEKKHPFDWTRAPLLRFHIHRRSETVFQLTLSFHHAILDGWSVASLLTELFENYLSLLKGAKTSFKLPPTVQFRDFVALERKFIALEEVKQFWLQKLAGSTTVVLPRWTSSRQTVSDASVYNIQVSISQETSACLKRLAQKMAVPIKSILLAVHLRVVSFLSGQTDILTGLVSNGRLEATDGERTLGLFLNTLPFRLRLSGETWTELILATFAAECELLPYRWYPLVEIQKQQGRRALFETVFNFTHFHVYQSLLLQYPQTDQKERKSLTPPPTSPDTDDGTRPVPNRSSDFALGVGTPASGMQVLGGGGFQETNFALTAHFSLDLISAQICLSLAGSVATMSREQIEAIGDYYALALSSLADEPQKPYALLPLLSAQEHAQLLEQGKATRQEYSQDRGIHQLFEEQVERTPDAVALVCEDVMLSYAELNRRANQLAHHLQGLGVGPEVVVGLCLKRASEMLVGLLGILKTGGAYLPLDTTSPPARLKSQLQESLVALLLTQEEQRAFLPIWEGTTLCLEEVVAELTQASGDNLPTSSGGEHLAYVISTSGSTGVPKGVMVRQSSVVNYTQALCEQLGVKPGWQYATVSTLAADLGNTAIFCALTSGGCVQVLGYETVTSGEAMANWTQQHPIDVLKIVPSHLSALLESERAGEWLPR